MPALHPTDLLTHLPAPRVPWPDVLGCLSPLTDQVRQESSVTELTLLARLLSPSKSLVLLIDIPLTSVFSEPKTTTMTSTEIMSSCTISFSSTPSRDQMWATVSKVLWISWHILQCLTRQKHYPKLTLSSRVLLETYLHRPFASVCLTLPE